MLIMRSFINLFFVPIITIYILEKAKNRKIDFSFDIVLRYCIATVCNIPITRILTFLMRVMFGMEIEPNDSYYTVVAMISAFVMVLLYRVILIFSEENKNKSE